MSDKELRELFEKRRSIRKYKRPATKEELMRILELARLAPSAKNMQPWRVVLVTEEAKRKEIMEKVCRDRSFVAEGSLVMIWTEPEVCYTSWRKKEGDNTHDVDAAIFATYLMLAATTLGLGTCWIAAFDEEPAFELFPEFKGKYRLSAIIVVGEPAEEPPLKGRKSVNEIVVKVI